MAGLPVILVVAIALACLFIGAWLGRLLTLYPRKQKPFTGFENMIGKIGTVTHANGNSLVVRYSNMEWNADLKEDSSAAVGESVLITEVHGNRLTVKKP